MDKPVRILINFVELIYSVAYRVLAVYRNKNSITMTFLCKLKITFKNKLPVQHVPFPYDTKRQHAKQGKEVKGNKKRNATAEAVCTTLSKEFHVNMNNVQCKLQSSISQFMIYSTTSIFVLVNNETKGTTHLISERRSCRS